MNTLDYKQLFEQGSASVVVVDENFVIVAASDTYLKVTKTTRGNIVGRDIFHVFPDNPDDIDANGESKLRASFNRVLKNKAADILDIVKYNIPKPESDEGGFILKYWRRCHSPVLDEFNNVKYIIQCVEDVTENEALIAQLEMEKRALKRIEESNKRYYLMLMQSPFAFSIMKGKDLVITHANDLMKEFWGKGIDVEGKTLLQVLPELADQPFPGMIDKVFTTGIPVYANEIVAQLKHNGKLEDRYFNIVYQPHYEADETISGVTTIAYEVTEHVLTLQKIQESEHRYHNMVHSSPSMICILKGEDLIIEIANDAILATWGKGNEVIGKPLLEVLPEIIEQGFADIFQNVYTTGITYQAHEMPTYVQRNGKMELSYYTFIYQAQRNIKDEIEGISIIASEVTSQALLNKKIKNSEERFRLLVMQAPVAICVLRGEDYVIETVNERMVEMWARKMEEVLHKPAFDVLMELRNQGFKELLDNVCNTGERFVAEELPINLVRNGKLENAFVKFVYEPMREADGTITGVMALAHEITDQVVARKRIEESEKQFRLLTNAMPQKITTADTAGNVTFFNQQWLDDTGYTFEELKDWGWEKAMHPDDLMLTIKNWQHSVLTGNVFDMECRILNTKGEYKWHLSRALPIKDENGNIKMWVGSNTEIHAHKEQKEELEKAVNSRTSQLLQKNVELENANKDLTSFTYVSSHDLQEPLRKIQNFATCILLEEEKNLSATGKGYFQRMMQTAKRMQTLIEDLLMYSRAKSGERIFENMDLNLLVNEVKLDFEEVIQQEKAIIEVTNLCTVRVIPLQFRQLLHNLISNSLKFSKPNTPQHIKIKSEIATDNDLNTACMTDMNKKLQAQKKYCHITFTDNGIGFDPQYKDRIFEVFQRLHSFEEYIGTGIGLAICKRIIENHNGIITATGKLNKGAQFDIYIPVD